MKVSEIKIGYTAHFNVSNGKEVVSGTGKVTKIKGNDVWLNGIKFNIKYIDYIVE